jgi:L-threonylcarbamoyladenylate synthase
MAPGTRSRRVRGESARSDPALPVARGTPAAGGVPGLARDDGRGEGLKAAPRPADEAGIAAAIDALSRGRLVLHPTETVVSLSGDPWNDAAVAAARALKGYRSPRPFVCLVPGVADARSLCRAWPAAAESLARAFWPGPLTLVLGASDEAPTAVAEAGRIALRPAADPVSSSLLAAWGRALFSTSANRRGEVSSRDVSRALAALGSAPGGDAIEVALLPLVPAAPGGSQEPVGLPSTLVDPDARPPKIVRAGAIPADRIREVVGEIDEGGD